MGSPLARVDRVLIAAASDGHGIGSSPVVDNHVVGQGKPLLARGMRAGLDQRELEPR